jgi:hypothetical protein
VSEFCTSPEECAQIIGRLKKAECAMLVKDELIPDDHAETDNFLKLLIDL